MCRLGKTVCLNWCVIHTVPIVWEIDWLHTQAYQFPKKGMSPIRRVSYKLSPCCVSSRSSIASHRTSKCGRRANLVLCTTILYTSYVQLKALRALPDSD